MVFFEVAVETEDGGEVWGEIDHEFSTETEVYDMKLQDIQVRSGEILSTSSAQRLRCMI